MKLKSEVYSNGLRLICGEKSLTAKNKNLKNV